MSINFHIGFQDQTETKTTQNLNIKGKIPNWLNGSLYRNGLGKFSYKEGTKELNHWFDGYSLLHRINIKNCEASYVSRFVDSKDYQSSNQKKDLCFRNFATDPNTPSILKLKRIFGSKIRDNPSVNILKHKGKLLALGETTANFEVDPEDLQTIQKYDFEVSAQAQGFGDLAHPLLDVFTGEYVNFGVKHSKNPEYYLYSVSQESNTKNIFWRKKVDNTSYIHTFGLSQNYAIVIETPLRAKPLDLIFNPLIKGHKWQENQNNKFWLINRQTGEETLFETNPFFFFHIGNTFETDKKVCIDISTYEDSKAIQEGFMLENIRKGNLDIKGKLERFELDLETNQISKKTLLDKFTEFPSINYKKDFANLYYRYIYSVVGLFDELTKLDLKTKEVKVWKEPNCYIGEPVFVSSPEAKNSDDGVILSVVLDGQNKFSFILILDGKSFKEVARIELPKVLPFGFHGSFVEEK